jgi:hypothetical protein
MSAAVPVVVPLVAGMSASVCVVAPQKTTREEHFFVHVISKEPVLSSKTPIF